MEYPDLDPAEEDEDENDDEDQPQAARRIVAPAGQVGSEPMRTRIKIISRMVPSTVISLVSSHRISLWPALCLQ
jgi:hypothetical protein